LLIEVVIILRAHNKMAVNSEFEAGQATPHRGSEEPGLN